MQSGVGRLRQGTSPGSTRATKKLNSAFGPQRHQPTTIGDKHMNEALAGHRTTAQLSNGLRRRSVPIVCFLVPMIDGYDTLMLSFIAPLISKEWGMEPGAFGAIFSSGYAGAMIGAVFFGGAAQRFWRTKRVLLCRPGRRAL